VSALSGAPPLYRFRAALKDYGAPGSQREAAGDGETEALAALDLACRCTGRRFSFARTGISGGGNRIRLYAEILEQDAGDAAFERIGTSAGLLFFQCCLDAVNGNFRGYPIDQMC
jgi:hypothetical protein